MPPAPDLRIEALASRHERADFSCGVDELDRYLKTQAGQDVRRKANGVFVLVESERADAVRRVHAHASTIGASMMVVDAISERAAGFYESHGFIRLPESPRLVLPMDVIKRLVGAS